MMTYKPLSAREMIEKIIENRHQKKKQAPKSEGELGLMVIRAGFTLF
jgi:hypothetical protein